MDPNEARRTRERGCWPAVCWNSDMYMLLALTWVMCELPVTEGFVKPPQSPCVVINHFGIETEMTQIGSWRSGCEGNRYVQGLWSPNVGQLFSKAKCCGRGKVKENRSWEIRDLQVFAGGGNRGTDKAWNVQCPNDSVITGFRFISDDRRRQVLSSMRCSLLASKVYDVGQCHVLDFTKGDSVECLPGNLRDASNDCPRVNETWAHECRTGYGLVGLYINEDDVTMAPVTKVERAKCCKLRDKNSEFGRKWKTSNLIGVKRPADPNQNYHHFSPRPRAHSGTDCGVINNFGTETKIKKIGSWKSGCTKNRYVRGVWSRDVGQLFANAKCCGSNEVIPKYSWELRDLQVFNGGESGKDQKWNIQCPPYSVITGFRLYCFNESTNNKAARGPDCNTNKIIIDASPNGNPPPGLNPLPGLDGIVSKDLRKSCINMTQILSSIRCSILTNKVYNSSQCSVLDFTDAHAHERNAMCPSVNVTWVHECERGYGLVALYMEKDRTMQPIRKVQKGKCCKIYGSDFGYGWRGDFKDNFAGFGQLSDELHNYYPFTIDGDAIVMEGDDFDGETRGKLLSPALSPQTQRDGYCLEMTVVHNGTNNATVSFTQLTKDSEHFIYNAYFHTKPHTRSTVRVLIRAFETSQIVTDVYVFNTSLRIENMKVLPKGIKCQVDSCSPAATKPHPGCMEHEECDKTTDNDYFHCICAEEYTPGNDFKCTYDKDKADEKRKRDEKKTTTISPPTSRTHTKKKIGNRIQVLLYAGGVAAIILVVIGLGICFCCRNSLSRKHRRLNSFEQEMSIVDRTNHLLSATSSSKVGNKSIYRPYMHDLGNVEQLSRTASDINANVLKDKMTPSTCDANSLPSNTYSNVPTSGSPEEYQLNDTPPTGDPVLSCGIDVTTGEPVYAQVNNGVDDTDEDCASSDYVGIMADDDERESTQTVRRNFSSETLNVPDYGESDSDDVDENPVGAVFKTPGDDEEECISQLNELTLDDVEITPRIVGQGAFGVTKYGVLRKGNQEVAVKMIKQRSGHEISVDERVKFYQEAVIVGQFDHLNVVSLFGIIVGKMPCMVLEFMSRGNLSKYLNKVRRTRKREGVQTVSREMQRVFLKMARDILEGMFYLASLQFVHRDLAARNVLLADNDGGLICKISDFGLSRHFIKDEEYYTSHGGFIPVKWTAPEAITSKKYSTQSDVWSYGIVLWEIWSVGQQPYENWSNEKVLKEVGDKGYRLPAPEAAPAVIYRLMADCWHHDKSQRPTFQQLKYCLRHRDERIIGKACWNKSLRSSRSSTYSSQDSQPSDDVTFNI